MAGETWYAVYVSRDGTLVSTGTSVAGDDELRRAGLSVVSVSGSPAENDWQWDPASRSFEPKPEVGSSTAELIVQQVGDIVTLTEEQTESIRQAVISVVGDDA